MGEEVGFLEVNCRRGRKMVLKMEADWKMRMRMQTGQYGRLTGRGDDWIDVADQGGC